MVYRIFYVCVLSLVVVGCASIGTKVTEAQLTQFEKGKTTYLDVVAALGKPTQATLHADGTREVYYTYTQSQMNPINFVPILAAFQQGSTSEQTTVILTFDARSLLTAFTATQGQMRVGTGITSGGRQ